MHMARPPAKPKGRHEGFRHDTSRRAWAGVHCTFHDPTRVMLLYVKNACVCCSISCHIRLEESLLVMNAAKKLSNQMLSSEYASDIDEYKSNQDHTHRQVRRERIRAAMS